MSLGPVMLGIDGQELGAGEAELLRHPLVGGVILFSRNYADPAQLGALVETIHGLRRPRLLVAVDQEGGRVQRFRDGFTRLPAVRRLGEIYDVDRLRAKQLARVTGWLMAAELRAVGVDFSFAPVLDVDHGLSTVIGDRAFHHRADAVADLAHAYVSGMQKAGMEAVGKHFPGHGGVVADSHLELPVDPRPLEVLRQGDVTAFERMVHYGLPAVMAAHVVYPAVDDAPAGYSRRWLRDVLRGELGFQGLVFSDDLDMAGAALAGGPVARARASLEAGCDMVLVCNDRRAAVAVLQGLADPADPAAHLRLARMHGRGRVRGADLRGSEAWQRAVRLVGDYDAWPLLDMDI